ncbi:MAG: membrane protein insertion efficiency factor YidD [Acidobacteriota bacterium]|nr:membrane protein insertion efficiency factor YidD [Acidobacteriota bacterium]
MAALALDLGRPPQFQWSTRAALGGIHAYQATLSPLYDRMGLNCRFTPTCSVYGEAVIRRFGIMRGSWMATKRVFRCGPWTPTGTADPPPTAPEAP